MAKNIFSMFQEYVPKPKRNVFDLSFNNNFTTKFGQLTPVLCKEVIPGDSFKIETAAGLRLMPMAFPVQTPMKAYVHYFYVRNRALWKDWQDFITGTKSGLVPPYIDSANLNSLQKEEFFKIGGIADYFGVPNVFYGQFGREVVFENSSTWSDATTRNAYMVADSYIIVRTYGGHFLNPSMFPFADYSGLENASVSVDSILDNLRRVELNYSDIRVGSDAITSAMPTSENPSTYIRPAIEDFELAFTRFDGYITLKMWDHPLNRGSQCGNFFIIGTDDNGVVTLLQSVEPTITEDQVFYANDNQYTTNRYDFSIDVSSWDNVSKIHLCHYIDLKYTINDTTATQMHQFTSTSFRSDYMPTLIYTSSVDGSTIGSFSVNDFDSTPYDSDIQLSALPFRAYECIYNSYYRNMQNNPYILNGVEEYNKFIPSNDGGADTNEYKLHQRNWEYDFMTSAVPSPQFGIAPLVGITMTGTATFQDENGTTYYAQAEYDDDGTITGWSTHSSNMPAGTLRMLMDSVGTGISINDLRNVNSFQRFLENSLRVGLKYRDQIKGHFGVDVRYDELEMPEFIGGMSLDINVNQVTQTADVQDSSYPLAGFAGQAGAFGSSKHSVTKYCDEHGFIIGILSVVPVPVYSQLLPKFFTKNEQLDYFFPEFGHIGYQPILQKEVSPLQSFYAGDDLNGVFGYQRAWYDYIASTDEVHSQFRTTLKDFVMNRTYDESPALNEDFLLVDPDQVNDVFLVTSDGEYGPESDKILGQLYFKITKKSPIPMLGIPRLTD